MLAGPMSQWACWSSELTGERVALLLGWSIRPVRYLGVGAPMPSIWHDLMHENYPYPRGDAYLKIEAGLNEDG